MSGTGTRSRSNSLTGIAGKGAKKGDKAKEVPLRKRNIPKYM